MISEESERRLRLIFLVPRNRIVWIYAVALIIVGGYFSFAGGGHCEFDSDLKADDLIKLRIWILLCAVMAIPVYLSEYRASTKILMMVANILLYFVVTYALFYKGTDFGLNAHWGDNASKLAITTKFKEFWSPFQDWYSKDLPSFYPPLWFFVNGKLAWLFDIEVYRMPKIMYFVTYAVLPVALYYAWSRIVSRRAALFIAFLTMFYRTSLLDYAPYEPISTAFFVPWWLYYVDDVKNIKNKSLKWYAYGGFWGALIFMTYYFWFIIGALSLIMRFIVRVVSQSRNQWGIQSFGHLIKIFGATALFSSVYWLPYLMSVIINGGYFTQGLWLRIEGGLAFDMPFFKFSLESMIYLIGLIHLGIRVKKAINSALLVVLAAAALGVMVDRICNLYDFSTQTRKVFELGPVVLAVPSGIALAAIYGWCKRRHAGLKGAFVLVALTAAIFIGTGHRAAASGGLWETAFKSVVPESGLEAFRSVDYRGKVFLTNKYIEAAYLPYYMFIFLNSSSAHPASQFLHRLEFLKELSRLEDPGEVAWLLRHNRFGRIDYVYLPIDSAGDAFLDIQILKFPAQFDDVHIVFPKATFPESPYLINRHRWGIYEITEPENFDARIIINNDNLNKYIDPSLKP